MSEERLLTTKQAAEALGVQQSRIYHLITAGRLVAARFGSAWMIKESDLEAVKVRKPGRPKKSEA